MRARADNNFQLCFDGMLSFKQLLSAEAPLLMSKACEIFIQELAVRAWMRAEEANKRTVESCDVAKAIVETDVFDFLTDILPPELIEPYTQNAQVSYSFHLLSYRAPFHLYAINEFLNDLP